MPITFVDPEVKAGYEIPTPIEKDFQVRVPSKQWHGQFSAITKEIAEELVKQGYNHLRAIPAKK